MAKSQKQSQFTSKFIPTPLWNIFKQSNLMDHAILWAASYTLYKRATKNLHLVTIFLQLVAKRRPKDFFNLEPCSARKTAVHLFPEQWNYFKLIYLSISPQFKCWVFGDVKSLCNFLLRFTVYSTHHNTSLQSKDNMWNELKMAYYSSCGILYMYIISAF